MDMSYLTGRGFTSVTTGEKDENGNWKIVVTMGESIQYPNGTKREGKVDAMGISTDYDEAHQTALKSCLQQLQDLVYSRGFDSLIEALDYQKGLEMGNADSSQADEDTA